MDKPTSRFLVDRLRKMPKEDQVRIMRQVEHLRVNYDLGLAASLELLYKLGRFLNERDA
jgi:hypothetical protein